MDSFIILFSGPSNSPSNLTGLPQDSTTISLTWDQPGDPHNGIIIEYRLNITEVEIGRMFQETSGTTSLVISNLHPDYTYEWVVTAFTVGEGPYSITSRVTTPEDGNISNRVQYSYCTYVHTSYD